MKYCLVKWEPVKTVVGGGQLIGTNVSANFFLNFKACNL